MQPSGRPGDELLLRRLQQQVDIFMDRGLLSASDDRLTRKWATLADQGLASLVAPDGSLNTDALRNFRRDQVLLHDLPTAALDGHRIRNRLSGWRRGTRNCLLQCLEILREQGYEHLLRKYPCHPAGNPHRFTHQGHVYTFRWARHLYFLGLLQKTLDDQLKGPTVVLDIGSSYGIFSSLVRQEYPRSRHVLVDVPEQLILAHYFLGSCFPDARITGPGDVIGLPQVTRAFLESQDFVLIPSSEFHRLAPDSVDLVANFGSFGEMSRHYFDTYLQSGPFHSARYLFMINRVAAVPEKYDNDITMLDYPIWDGTKRLHFDVCPIYSVDFLIAPSSAFGYEVGTPDLHFEYVGRI